MCMLLDAPEQWDRYGKEGSQFGVRNMCHHPDGGNMRGNAVWQAETQWNELPRFMLGANGLFGHVTGTDVSGFNADGSFKVVCQ